MNENSRDPSVVSEKILKSGSDYNPLQIHSVQKNSVGAILVIGS